MSLFLSIVIFIEALIISLFRILGPIVLILTVLIGIKILYRYKKYGYLEFDVFRKRETTKFIEIILMMLDKINGYRKIINVSNLYADLTIIDKTGLYLIKLIKYEGSVNGVRNDLILKNRLKVNVIKDIANPFYYLEQDKQKLLKIDENLEIKTILVTSNISQVNIQNVSKEECLILKDFYFVMEHNFSKTQIYDNNEINKLYKKI
ncbi:MAG: hypothetical protein RR050_00865, partial [Bacilli bacterium]